MSFALGDLTLRFGNGPRPLQHLSLQVRAGERVAVIGPSGAGKTSLLRVLGCALRPSEGRLEVLGHDPGRESAQLAQGRDQPGRVVHAGAGVGVLEDGFAYGQALEGREHVHRLAAPVHPHPIWTSPPVMFE